MSNYNYLLLIQEAFLSSKGSTFLPQAKASTVRFGPCRVHLIMQPLGYMAFGCISLMLQILAIAMAMPAFCALIIFKKSNEVFL